MTSEVRGGLEAAKWVAFVLMVADHVNSFLVPHAHFSPVVYLLGRLVFPMFACCLAYGLAGRGALVLDGVVRRLFLWACIAQVPWGMFHQGVALNVVFTLCFGTALYQAVFSRGLGVGRYAAVVCGVALSFVAEYSIPGVLLVFGLCWFAESRSRWGAGIAAVALLALVTVNGTWFAVLGPLVFGALYRWTELPRLRHAFYWFYPAHFVVLGFLRWWL